MPWSESLPVNPATQRIPEGVSRREITADLAPGELSRVEVQIGPSLTQVRELCSERGSVALGRVPLTIERAANPRIREEDSDRSDCCR